MEFGYWGEFWVYALSWAALMFFIAYVMYSWSWLWWKHRRYDIAFTTRFMRTNVSATTWELSYFPYKAWSWIVRILAAGIALYHFLLGCAWLADLGLYVWEQFP
jgi:hypothetical protein